MGCSVQRVKTAVGSEGKPGKEAFNRKLTEGVRKK